MLRRHLDIPEPTCATPDPTIGCAFQEATTYTERNSDDWLGGAYFNATAGKRLALSLEYAYEQRDFDFTQVSNNSLFEDYMQTQRLRPQVRFFLPMGFFASVRATQYKQEVHQFDDPSSTARITVNADFWIGDLQLGYRLPKRWGSVVLNAANINNEKFVYYRSSLEEDLVPTRVITLGINFATP